MVAIHCEITSTMRAIEATIDSRESKLPGKPTKRVDSIVTLERSCESQITVRMRLQFANSDWLG